jgi:hypothetical protein
LWRRKGKKLHVEGRMTKAQESVVGNPKGGLVPSMALTGNYHDGTAWNLGQDVEPLEQ